MKKIILVSLYVVCNSLLLPLATTAQAPSDAATSTEQKITDQTGLFETDKILEITLSGNIKGLLNDRSENPKMHPLTLKYKDESNNEISIPAEGKTRGHFRKLRDNCDYPPLAIHFSKSDTLVASIFKEQHKLKLVMPCVGDEYVIREWLVYKIYNLVTPKSFRARLVRITLDDAKSKKAPSPFYGILVEEEKQMAKRNGNVAVNSKIKPADTDTDAFTTMSVFEYLVGNTDWSVQYLQNIKLIAKDSTGIPTAVPYDFDHAGLVNPPYAKPAEELLMNSVRDRRYRGYCVTDMKKFDGSIALFNRIKNDIYSIYNECVLLDEKYKKATIKYLDEFYATINNPGAVKKEFGYPCDKNGTGNVVIKGLRED